jgi:hypothetical protein
MEESTPKPGSETELDQITESAVKEDLRAQWGKKNPEIRIPRHQNQMVAEHTSDMFMSGLMCE